MQISIDKVQIESSWKKVLKDEFLKPYFYQLKQNLLISKKQNIIYPPSNLIFNAFSLTPFNKIKVVILGQDPYHQPNQAMGLSFSVPNSMRIPPSLKNIYKEIQDDLGIIEPNNGDLTYWAKQGILLLNTTLTVEANRANSHSNLGWQTFTDSVIKKINDEKNNIIFLLWGNYAKAKTSLIDQNKHFILTASHPSPLARGAFFGCKHFSKTNEILLKIGKAPIDWDLNNFLKE